MKPIDSINVLYSELTSRGNIFCYPFTYTEADGDFYDYIHNLLERFVDRVKQLDKDAIDLLNHSFDKLPSDKIPEKQFDFLRDIDSLAGKVFEVLKDSYRNYPDDAFNKLRTFFEKDDFYYLNMLPQLKIERGALYRIRTDSIDKSNDGELFHIPFEKRYLISSQRYSFPGYPILYLSGSLFTAWCEMNKPDLEGLSYTRFEFKDEELFLDLSYPYARQEMWEMYSLFVMYPLLMACMTRVNHPQAPFKPEYIFPQLMAKLVREYSSMFAGIAYMSNKLPDSYPMDGISSRNFAVFTNNGIARKGYDKDLAKRLQMTNIQTITKDQIRESVSCSNNRYEIDFRKLESFNDSPLRDVEVSMEV